MSTIPVIDIAPLANGSPDQAQAVATALGRACRDVGFFYVTGHGISPELIARVFDSSAAFFTGPASIREAASFTGAGGNRGYIRLGGEALDPGKPADVKEAFNIGLELAPDDPELLARAPFRGANLWPDMPGFRDTMLDYFNRVWRLGCDLHRGFALDLGLDPDFFETKLDKPIATLRLLHYPPTPAPLSDGQLGAGVHTDYGNVTLLATDAVGGLMVRDRSGRWLDAPVIPGAFRLQYRRLPDAMVERCLCFDAAQGGQPAQQGPIFGGVLPRSQSGCRGRMPADLHESGSSGEIRSHHRRRIPALAA